MHHPINMKDIPGIPPQISSHVSSPLLNKNDKVTINEFSLEKSVSQPGDYILNEG
jgi:hypothetical protein